MVAPEDRRGFPSFTHIRPHRRQRDRQVKKGAPPTTALVGACSAILSTLVVQQSWMLAQPMGGWIVGGLDLIGCSVGLYWCVSAVVDYPMKSLALPERHGVWVKPLCWFGLISCGMALMVVGILFLIAASTHDASSALAALKCPAGRFGISRIGGGCCRCWHVR
jgi:hypothetical protein